MTYESQRECIWKVQNPHFLAYIRIVTLEATFSTGSMQMECWRYTLHSIYSQNALPRKRPHSNFNPRNIQKKEKSVIILCQRYTFTFGVRMEFCLSSYGVRAFRILCSNCIPRNPKIYFRATWGPTHLQSQRAADDKLFQVGNEVIVAQRASLNKAQKWPPFSSKFFVPRTINIAPHASYVQISSIGR